MMQPEMLASMPLWLSGLLLSAGAIAASVVIGLMIDRLIPVTLRTEHNETATAMLAVVGTTYAVLLAFVAMLAWETFDKARDNTDLEASMVEKAFSLGQTLPARERAAVQTALQDYTREVIDIEWPAQKRGRPIAVESRSLHSVEAIVMTLEKDGRLDGALQPLLAEADDIVSAREARLRSANSSIPLIAWFVLLAGGSITVCLASLLGATDLRLHLAMVALLAVSGALVLLVIISLSSPFRGETAVSDLPFRQLLAEMTQP